MWESWPRRCEAVLILKPCLSCYGPFRHFHWVSCGQRCTQWVTLTWALPQTGTCWNASRLGCQCPPPPLSHLHVCSQFHSHNLFPVPSGRGGAALAPNGGHRAGFMPPSASFPGCDPGEAVALLGSSPPPLSGSLEPQLLRLSKPHSLSQPHLRSSGPREAPGSLSREQFALSIPDIFPYFVHLPPWSMSSEREDLAC